MLFEGGRLGLGGADAIVLVLKDGVLVPLGMEDGAVAKVLCTDIDAK